MEENKRGSFKWDKDGKAKFEPDPNGRFIMGIDPYDGKEVNNTYIDEAGQREAPKSPKSLIEAIKKAHAFIVGGYQDYAINVMEEFYKGTKVFNVTIPNFTNSIAINNKTRVKPYREGYKSPKVPKKYLTPEYGYVGGKLVLLDTGEVIPSNSSQAGRAKLWLVNGQDIYNGKIHEYARDNYMDKLKDFIRPYIEETPCIYDEHMQMELRFFFTDRGKNNVDDDNLWIWEKAIGDVMKNLIISDDNPKILFSHLKSSMFVTNDSDTRLEIILWAKN